MINALAHVTYRMGKERMEKEGQILWIEKRL